jgi:16S rRNA (guanine527-N7)-methyltransferase
VKQIVEDCLKKNKIPFQEITIPKLLKYVDDLSTWGKRLGLISKRLSRKEIFFLHVFDSLMVTKFISPPREKKIADVGSGAGLPGIPVSIFWQRNKIFLIDSKQKAVSFLLREKKVLKLSNVEVLRGYVGEDLLLREYDIVLVRAFLPLQKCLEKLLPITSREAAIVFYQTKRGWKEKRSNINLKSVEVKDFYYQIPYLERERAIVVFKKIKNQ